MDTEGWDWRWPSAGGRIRLRWRSGEGKGKGSGLYWFVQGVGLSQLDGKDSRLHFSNCYKYPSWYFKQDL